MLSPKIDPMIGDLIAFSGRINIFIAGDSPIKETKNEVDGRAERSV